jgi:hypothetical protein
MMNVLAMFDLHCLFPLKLLHGGLAWDQSDTGGLDKKHLIGRAGMTLRHRRANGHPANS